jgi:hypothetical protein
MASADSTATFRPVPGFPGYRVGDDGSVWSQLRNSKGAEVLDGWHRITGGLDKDGYHKLILCEAGKRRYVRVNVLVLEVFAGPRPERMTAAHCNGIKGDNRVANLRWATQKSNIADKRLHGTHQAGEKHPHHKLTVNQVQEIRARRAAGETVSALAKVFSVRSCTISAIATRRLWRHVG